MRRQRIGLLLLVCCLVILTGCTEEKQEIKGELVYLPKVAGFLFAQGILSLLMDRFLI